MKIKGNGKSTNMIQLTHVIGIKGEITLGITKVKQGSQHRPGNSEGIRKSLHGIQSTHVIGIKGKLRRDPQSSHGIQSTHVIGIKGKLRRSP